MKMIGNKYHPVYKEEDVPKWKKDLMQRRKNLSKTIVSGGGLVKLTVTCPANMVKTVSAKINPSNTQNQINSQRQSIPDMNNYNKGKTNETYINGKHETAILLDETNVQSFLVNDTKKDTNKQKTVDIKLKINDEDYHSDLSEESEEKTRNVSAIKDKLLTKCLSPSPVKNLERKAISYEDILNLDSNRLKPKYNINKGHGSMKINQYQTKYLESVNATRNNANIVSKINTADLPNANDTKKQNFVKERAKMFEKNDIENIQTPKFRKTNVHHIKRPISFRETSTGFSWPLTEAVEELVSKQVWEEVKPLTDKQKDPRQDLAIYSKFIESNIPSEFGYMPPNAKQTVLTTCL